jgi:hypothetical protein
VVLVTVCVGVRVVQAASGDKSVAASARSQGHALRSLSTTTAGYYAELLLALLLAHFSRTDPGVAVAQPALATKTVGGTAGVDAILAVPSPAGVGVVPSRRASADAAATVEAESARVCVRLRRALSLLRLHVPLLVDVVRAMPGSVRYA